MKASLDYTFDSYRLHDIYRFHTESKHAPNIDITVFVLKYVP
jgi:hypothetical protein